MEIVCNDCGHTEFIGCGECESSNISIFPDIKEYIKYIETHLNQNSCPNGSNDVFNDHILSPIIKLTYDFCRETSCSCMDEDIHRLVSIALNKFDYTNTFVQKSKEKIFTELTKILQ